jgi:multidrug efflux pump subunit AcrA (membrane-fusion protein)
MLKKIIFLVIALLVVGLAFVSAQDMAKLQQLQAELEQIQARANARGGSFTPQEVQRMNEIQNEMMQAAGIGGSAMQGSSPNAFEQQFFDMEQRALQQGQQEQQVRQQQLQREQQQRREEYIREHTGTNRNWPVASVYTSRFNISELRQPSGTTASYNTDESRNAKTGSVLLMGITIYLHNATDNAVQDIKRQVEAATRKTMEGTGDGFGLFIRDYIPNGWFGNLGVGIQKLEHGIVKFYIYDSRGIQ